jgi:hypothetical protein
MPSNRTYFGPYTTEFYNSLAGLGTLPEFDQPSSQNEYTLPRDRPSNDEFYTNLDWFQPSIGGFPSSSNPIKLTNENFTGYNNNQSSSTSNNSMAADYRSGQSFGTASGDYQTKINNIIKEVQEGRMDPTEGDARIAELQRQEFGASSFDIGEFEGLLGRLEGSKKRQQRQKSVEGRRDIMQQGLASMMSNF